MKQDSSVSRVTGYRLSIHDSIPSRICFCFQNIQINTEVQSAYSPLDHVGLFPPRLHLMSEPRTFGTLPEHPLCAFMVAMMVCLYLYAFPCSVIYNIVLQATDAYNFYTTGQNKIQQGFLKDGYELISEALNLLNNVYGAMHPEIAQCLRMLARLNYIMGEHAEAMAYQQKAVLMSERVNGIDHPYTITEYVSNN